MIATASDDKTIKLWSLDGTQFKTLNGHEDYVMSVSFSPDGTTLASASKDKTVILWTLNQERLAESASLWTLTLDELIFANISIFQLGDKQKKIQHLSVAAGL